MNANVRGKDLIPTPRNVGITSTHIFSDFNDGDRVIFPVTIFVEDSGSPAVRGGAVAKLPQMRPSTVNERFKEGLQLALKGCID